MFILHRMVGSSLFHYFLLEATKLLVQSLIEIPVLENKIRVYMSHLSTVWSSLGACSGKVLFFHRITEYPELKGTPRDHQVQLLCLSWCVKQSCLLWSSKFVTVTTDSLTWWLKGSAIQPGLMSIVGLMSHTQCDSSASSGDPRVLSQVGLCHDSCPRACVFEHWQELSPTDPFPLKSAECGTRAAPQGDASVENRSFRRVHCTGAGLHLWRVNSMFKHQKPNSNSNEKLLGSSQDMNLFPV